MRVARPSIAPTQHKVGSNIATGQRRLRGDGTFARFIGSSNNGLSVARTAAECKASHAKAVRAAGAFDAGRASRRSARSSARVDACQKKYSGLVAGRVSSRPHSMCWPRRQRRPSAVYSPEPTCSSTHTPHKHAVIRSVVPRRSRGVIVGSMARQQCQHRQHRRRGHMKIRREVAVRPRKDDVANRV